MATINIQATGKAKQAPDQMVVTIHLSNLYNSYKGALNASELAYETFLKAFEKAGFDKQQLFLESYGIDEDYEYVQEKRQLRGYKYRYRLRYTMDLDLARYQDFLKLAAKLDSDPLLDLHYGVKDHEGLRLLAIKDAIEKGNQQASFIATTLNASLGKLTKIDLRNEPVMIQRSRAMAMEASALSDMAVEPIEDEVTLAMDFHLEV